MLSAIKWGAIVGVAIYIIAQALTLIGQATLGSQADPAHPGTIALGCVQLLLIAFAFSTSGFYAGRETRVAGYGAIAGMVTFAVYGLLLGFIPVGSHVALSASGSALGRQVVIDLISALLFLSIAALIGWLGGRPGATRGQAAALRANESSK